MDKWNTLKALRGEGGNWMKEGQGLAKAHVCITHMRQAGRVRNEGVPKASAANANYAKES